MYWRLKNHHDGSMFFECKKSDSMIEINKNLNYCQLVQFGYPKSGACLP